MPNYFCEEQTLLEKIFKLSVVPRALFNTCLIFFHNIRQLIFLFEISFRHVFQWSPVFFRGDTLELRTSVNSDTAVMLAIHRVEEQWGLFIFSAVENVLHFIIHINYVTIPKCKSWEKCLDPHSKSVSCGIRTVINKPMFNSQDHLG